LHDKARREDWEADRSRLRPGDIAHYEDRGLVCARMMPLVEDAGLEARDVIHGLGGPEEISPQQSVLVEDLVRLGVVTRALMGLLLSGDGDPAELAGRLSTLVAQRRQLLQTLGLHRFERELDPTQPVRVVFQGEHGPWSDAESTNASGGDLTPTPTGDRGPERAGGRE